MKNNILIVCTAIVIFTLSAFTYSNWNSPTTNKVCSQSTKLIEPPTLFYNLSPPGNNTVTKERLHNTKSISDLMPDYTIQENLKNNITSLRDVKIRIEEGNGCNSKNRSVEGNGNILSKEQIKLLKSTEYSTNFILEGFITNNNLISGSNDERYFNYNMTVVPEQQASYKAGNVAFIDFLKIKCQPTVDKVQKGNLKYGNISFTVTKNGTIINIKNSSTCGYPSIDERMMYLMNKIPGVWNVATNDKGEKVSQNLVFSYGQTGC